MTAETTMREALEPFAARCREKVRPDDSDNDGVTVRTGDLRRAERVLAATTTREDAPDAGGGALSLDGLDAAEASYDAHADRHGHPRCDPTALQDAIDDYLTVAATARPAGAEGSAEVLQVGQRVRYIPLGNEVEIVEPCEGWWTVRTPAGLCVVRPSHLAALAPTTGPASDGEGV